MPLDTNLNNEIIAGRVACFNIPPGNIWIFNKLKRTSGRIGNIYLDSKKPCH